ncbi:MAG: nucleotidyltransferase domain-containing protein [Nanoarchaeota archaeon]|nr:nucleotidyltransferase domain-containing protein [Nanoarchaeota archaeon]
MALTKTDIAVLGLFASKILERFTIREAARLLKKGLKIVHTSIKKLAKEGFLIREKPNGLKLNYKKHLSELAYAESARKEAFFKKHRLIQIYAEKAIETSRTKLLILLIFGSYAAGKNKANSDIDLLVIIPEYDESVEQQITSSLSFSPKKFHAVIISEESFREMLKKRDEMNVVNETLNNHIILYGAEQYYGLLGERDVR